MIYDIIVDLIKHLSISLSFLKPYATLLGVIVLLLRQNNIKKIINGRLPKKFRDTQSSDIYDMMRDIKLIKEHLGVKDWENTQMNGQKTIPILKFKRFISYLQTVTNRREIFKMSKWTSRKFLMAILAAVLPIINEQFDMGLDTGVIIAAIGGIVAFILGESHIDAKRAGGQTDAKYTIDDSTHV